MLIIVSMSRWLGYIMSVTRNVLRDYRKKPRLSKTQFSICVLALTMSATLQADNSQAGKFYEEALSQFHAKNYKAAILDLKNVLGEQPDNLAARILLGQSYLKDQQLNLAEHELREAEKTGADRALLVASWAELYLAQLRAADLLDKITPGSYSQAVNYKIHVFRGHAFLQISKPDEALTEYEKAFSLDSRQADALIGKADALLRKNQAEQAYEAAQQGLKKSPVSPEAWETMASVQHARHNSDDALKSYGKAIELNPDLISARLARVGLYMDLQKNDLAAPELEYLRAKFPQDAKAAYLHAVLLEHMGRKEDARKELEIAANILGSIKPELLSQHSPSLLLTGLVNFSLARFEQATAYLKKYIALFPNQIGPYKLLASIYLGNKQPGKAIELLEAGLPSAGSDYQFLLALGNAYMQLGRHEKADTVLNNATKIAADTAGVHRELGLSRLALGQEDLAVQEFEKALKAKPDDITSGINLTTLYLKRGQIDKALKLAGQMCDREPKNLSLLNLLGNIQFAAGLLPEADATFKTALALDTESVSAQLNLSKLAVAEKKFADAEQILLGLNSKMPDDIPVMVELARLHAVQNKYDDALSWLQKAKKINAKSLPVVLAMIEVFLKNGKNLDALREARDAADIFPGDLQVLDALAKSYLATGNTDKAAATYQGMARDAGFNEKLLFEIARQQTALGDYKGAIKSLKIAVQANGDFLPARAALAELYLLEGEKIFALNEAQSLLERHPDKGVGYRILGDIDSYDKKPAQALAHYQTAFDKEQTIDNLIRLYKTLDSEGQRQKALQLLAEWVKKHPGDGLPMQALAENYLRSGQLEKAKGYYEKVNALVPNQPTILNNLASIYFELGNPSALSFAEQAKRLAPDQPAINDTLGWILVNQDQAERGLEYLRNAYSRAAQNPEIRYHVAVALHKLKRMDEAKTELEQLLRDSENFDKVAEAKALLNQLSR